ncbi:MAG: acyltransferase [Flavobacteriales bacterium]|nr:acyltransferase [Flavobacteriales bacterium]
MNERLYNLDYLRGLAASGIMLFHYMSKTFGEFNAESFMGRVGLYGVSVFYVLSGLTLFYVYHDKMKPALHDVGDFFIKRVFRIMPLLWLATIASVFCFNGGIFEWKKLFLNLTGIFGFVAWDQGIAVGVWSIGNELVFYVFFPIFVLLSKRSRALFAVFVIAVFAIYCFYAFYMVIDELPFKAKGQQYNYVNPLNQLFLFLSGYLIGLILRPIMIKPIINTIILIAGLLIFVLYPVHGDRIHLVADFPRLILTAACIMVCIGFYKLRFHLPGIVDRALKLLGEASYSVYLLHMIVFQLTGFIFEYIRTHFFHVPEFVRFFSSIILTFVLSYFVYQYFEKYFIKLGKKVSASLISK